MRQLTSKEIQSEVLGIMKQVHEFCELNDIEYSLEGGSLIGAIRHKGFIPWDDDIDIMMTRPNFNKFCKLFCHEDLDIMVPGQQGYYLRFARVLDKEKTVVREHKVPFSEKETGIWIDIFPIDKMPDNAETFNRITDKANSFQKYSLAYRHNLYNRILSKEKSSLKEKITLFLRYIYRRFKLFKGNKTFLSLEKQIEKDSLFLSQFSNDKTSYYGGLCFAHNNYSNRYPTEWFDKYILVDFEDTKFKVIQDYDKYLRTVFGDYMVIPPKEKQVVHNFFKVYYK